MASRNFRSQFNYSYSAQAVTLRAKVSIGSTGAPTIASNTGMGITSVTRNSAGNYSIKLADPYASTMGLNISIQSGSSAPAAPNFNIVSDAVATSGAAILIVQFRNLSGSATDPASGEILHIEIVLNNSSNGY